MGDGAADDLRRPLLVATKADPASAYASLSEPPSHSSPSPITSLLPEEREDMDGVSRKTQWIILAVASGTCAAFNGVFAKLYVIRLFPIISSCYVVLGLYKWPGVEWFPLESLLNNVFIAQFPSMEQVFFFLLFFWLRTFEILARLHINIRKAGANSCS